MLVERSEFEALLNQEKLTVKDLEENSDRMQKINAALNVDAIVTGTVTPTSQGFSVDVLVRRTQDSRLQCSASDSFPRSEFSSTTITLTPEEAPSPPVQAGANGIGNPQCVYCPNPDYSDEVRRQKIEGAVLLSIVVTREGRTTGIAVLKAPNDVLAKKAVEAVRDWRLKPATDREGNPVTARVNVEIYFRLLN